MLTHCYTLLVIVLVIMLFISLYDRRGRYVCIVEGVGGLSF